MVDAVVTVFLEKLLNALEEEGRVLFDFREQFEILRDELRLMQSFLKDAERLKRKNETLRTVMIGLRELIYEAEDILADCKVQSEGSQDISGWYAVCFYPTNLPFKYQTGKRLREINEKITRIKQNIPSFLGVPILSQAEIADSRNLPVDRWSSSVFDHSQVVGIEGDTRKVKNWLLEAKDGILAIGIVGMGGVNSEIFLTNDSNLYYSSGSGPPYYRLGWNYPLANAKWDTYYSTCYPLVRYAQEGPTRNYHAQQNRYRA